MKESLFANSFFQRAYQTESKCVDCVPDARPTRPAIDPSVRGLELRRRSKVHFRIQVILGEPGIFGSTIRARLRSSGSIFTQFPCGSEIRFRQWISSGQRLESAWLSSSSFTFSRSTGSACSHTIPERSAICPRASRRSKPWTILPCGNESVIPPHHRSSRCIHLDSAWKKDSGERRYRPRRKNSPM